MKKVHLVFSSITGEDVNALQEDIIRASEIDDAKREAYNDSLSSGDAVTITVDKTD